MRRTKREIMEGVQSVRSQVVANNTVEYEGTDGSKVYRLHLTDIVTCNPDGSVTLNSGGWKTTTTKERMNRFQPHYITQEQGVWYIDINNNKIPYADGMTIWPNGKFKGEGKNPKKQKALQKQVKDYSKRYILELFEGNILKPDDGDCWFCRFNLPGYDHILTHIKENYYVPSLLIRALDMFPTSRAAKYAIHEVWFNESKKNIIFEDIAKIQLESVLKKYIRHCLSLP